MKSTLPTVETMRVLADKALAVRANNEALRLANLKAEANSLGLKLFTSNPEIIAAMIRSAYAKRGIK